MDRRRPTAVEAVSVGTGGLDADGLTDTLFPQLESGDESPQGLDFAGLENDSIEASPKLGCLLGDPGAGYADDDRFSCPRLFTNPAASFDAVRLRHAKVQNDYIGLEADGGKQAFGRTISHDGSTFLSLKEVRERVSIVLTIIDHQNLQERLDALGHVPCFR
jgi:hypothetical protein